MLWLCDLYFIILYKSCKMLSLYDICTNITKLAKFTTATKYTKFTKFIKSTKFGNNKIYQLNKIYVTYEISKIFKMKQFTKFAIVRDFILKKLKTFQNFPKVQIHKLLQVWSKQCQQRLEKKHRLNTLYLSGTTLELKNCNVINRSDDSKIT